jgi:hypothetical protein
LRKLFTVVADTFTIQIHHNSGRCGFDKADGLVAGEPAFQVIDDDDASAVPLPS